MDVQAVITKDFILCGFGPVKERKSCKKPYKNISNLVKTYAILCRSVTKFKWISTKAVHASTVAPLIQSNTTRLAFSKLQKYPQNISDPVQPDPHRI